MEGFNMIYGYIRTESQKLEIARFAQRNGVSIDGWVENIDEAAEGDIVIASEVSQLGCDPLQALDMLRHLLGIGACVWSAREGYKLGGGATGKALAFAFGVSADLKRRMGRPLGRRNSKPKLIGGISAL